VDGFEVKNRSPSSRPRPTSLKGQRDFLRAAPRSGGTSAWPRAPRTVGNSPRDSEAEAVGWRFGHGREAAMNRQPQALQTRSSPPHSQPRSQTSSPDSRRAWKIGSSRGGNHPIQNSATLSDPHLGHGWSLPTGVGVLAARGRSPRDRVRADRTASSGDASGSDCDTLMEVECCNAGRTRRSASTLSTSSHRGFSTYGADTGRVAGPWH
jgi:hypothetical protein